MFHAEENNYVAHAITPILKTYIKYFLKDAKSQERNQV